ncbi:MAG: polysaccharide lyase 6 family protein [Caulobacter sp.]|nr:polysaccharide lyase 6 family protein [Caulobacter sp.]
MRSLVIAAALLALAQPAMAERRILVRSPGQFDKAVARIAPGDTIVLADGVWRDARLDFHGAGRAGKPITLTAQTPGRVVLSGQSNLRMSGAFLVVSNLVFRDGYSPTDEVVSFRRAPGDHAVDSRVTGVVIDRYNKPERETLDHWVALYGERNRFDHGHLVGKTNIGPTLVVIREPVDGLRNDHRIDHNFFGPRPNVRANGGETIRVGTSHYAHTASHTTVDSNWFEHCDGENEIVSNKSGENTFRGNVFFESQGALTLRHGDNALVEGNAFLGNGKPHTGGIRVINRGQTVRNNYLENLEGEATVSALSIMYGVPNSPPTRYVQVEGAVIEHNTIINARSIAIGLGMDQERTLAPINSRLDSNLIVNLDGSDPVRIKGDASGVALTNNVRDPKTVLRRRANGQLAAVGAGGVGAGDMVVVQRAATGVSWYPKD